jgi:hypothetical protein
MNRATPGWSIARATAITTLAAAALAVTANPAAAERDDSACEAWSQLLDSTSTELTNLQPGQYIGAPRLLANLARAAEGVQEYC